MSDRVAAGRWARNLLDCLQASILRARAYNDQVGLLLLECQHHYVEHLLRVLGGFEDVLSEYHAAVDEATVSSNSSETSSPRQRT